MYEPHPEKTGLLIRQQRNLAGLTQKALAEELGVTDKAVSKWETGDGLPDIALLPRLARCLAVTVDELLSGQLLGKKQATASVSALLAFGLAAYLFLSQLHNNLSNWLGLRLVGDVPGGPFRLTAFLLVFLSVFYYFCLAVLSSQLLMQNSKAAKFWQSTAWLLVGAGFMQSLLSVWQNLTSLQLARSSFFWLGLALFFLTSQKALPARVFTLVSFLALLTEASFQLLLLLSQQALGLKIAVLPMFLQSLVLLVFLLLANQAWVLKGK